MYPQFLTKQKTEFLYVALVLLRALLQIYRNNDSSRLFLIVETVFAVIYC